MLLPKRLRNSLTLTNALPSLTRGTDGNERSGFISNKPLRRVNKLLMTSNKSDVSFTGRKRLLGTFMPWISNIGCHLSKSYRKNGIVALTDRIFKAFDCSARCTFQLDNVQTFVSRLENFLLIRMFLYSLNTWNEKSYFVVDYNFHVQGVGFDKTCDCFQIDPQVVCVKDPEHKKNFLSALFLERIFCLLEFRYTLKFFNLDSKNSWDAFRFLSVIVLFQLTWSLGTWAISNSLIFPS